AELSEAARLNQVRVTHELRQQAQRAIAGFVQELLDEPRNRSALAAISDEDLLARQLWSEALIVVYRLLFILKLESSPDLAEAFSFASSSLWRNTYSPNRALATVATRVLNAGASTGSWLSQG